MTDAQRKALAALDGFPTPASSPSGSFEAALARQSAALRRLYGAVLDVPMLGYQVADRWRGVWLLAAGILASEAGDVYPLYGGELVGFRPGNQSSAWTAPDVSTIEGITDAVGAGSGLTSWLAAHLATLSPWGRTVRRIARASCGTVADTVDSAAGRLPVPCARRVKDAIAGAVRVWDAPPKARPLLDAAGVAHMAADGVAHVVEDAAKGAAAATGGILASRLLPILLGAGAVYFAWHEWQVRG